MRVLGLGCGVGNLSLWMSKLVGPSGLVVGVDESPEAIDVAQKRATVAGQCYWTRFVTADLKTFILHERFDVVVVRTVPAPQRATLLRLSSYVQPDGVIIITGNPAEVRTIVHRNELGRSPRAHQRSILSEIEAVDGSSTARER
jgi:2-polyprenyl-3-methyl-5-hydroxy-6-metoxy-1,4-benzoquinol methylase